MWREGRRKEKGRGCRYRVKALRARFIGFEALFVTTAGEVDLYRKPRDQSVTDETATWPQLMELMGLDYVVTLGRWRGSGTDVTIQDTFTRFWNNDEDV